MKPQRRKSAADFGDNVHAWALNLRCLSPPISSGVHIQYTRVKREVKGGIEEDLGSIYSSWITPSGVSPGSFGGFLLDLDAK